MKKAIKEKAAREFVNSMPEMTVVAVHNRRGSIVDVAIIDSGADQTNAEWDCVEVFPCPTCGEPVARWADWDGSVFGCDCGWISEEYSPAYSRCRNGVRVFHPAEGA